MVINILAFDWFQDKERYHRAFHVRDDETGELLSDDLEVHFLELEKVKRVRRRPKDALESWMMYLSNLEGEELEAIAMDNPGIRKSLTIEQSFWQSKKERRLYLHRQFAGGSPGRRRRRGKVTKKARKGTSHPLRVTGPFAFQRSQIRNSKWHGEVCRFHLSAKSPTSTVFFMI